MGEKLVSAKQQKTKFRLFLEKKNEEVYRIYTTRAVLSI